MPYLGTRFPAAARGSVGSARRAVGCGQQSSVLTIILRVSGRAELSSAKGKSF